MARQSPQYGVHRTTVMTYLERRGVAPRRQGHKMNDDSVTVAVQRYEGGLSLAAVAAEFGVHQPTLARELRAAGMPLRPRNGWPTSPPKIR